MKTIIYGGRNAGKTLSLHYFKEKFTAIPEEQWCTKYYESVEMNFIQFCAMGHCGATLKKPLTMESTALINLFAPLYSLGTSIPSINDSQSSMFPQDTPRGRILAAIEWLIIQENAAKFMILDDEPIYPSRTKCVVTTE